MIESHKIKSTEDDIRAFAALCIEDKLYSCYVTTDGGYHYFTTSTDLSELMRHEEAR